MPHGCDRRTGRDQQEDRARPGLRRGRRPHGRNGRDLLVGPRVQAVFHPGRDGAPLVPDAGIRAGPGQRPGVRGDLRSVAAELGIDEVYQGSRQGRAGDEVGGLEGLELDEFLYMGDDHIDLPVFDAVGVSVAPANADPHVRARATHVTAARGGDGAVREAIEWLLAGAGRLEEALAAYRERVTGEATEPGA